MIDTDLLKRCPTEAIQSAFLKADLHISDHKNICVSVSGGSDSDIVVDMVEKCRNGKKVTYVFYDTGLEYDATKRHLTYLEERYGITIERVKAYMPIPTVVKKYGQPVFSKLISEMIERLQHRKFDFKEHDFEYMKTKGMSVAKWWCNESKIYQIDKKRGLKQYMIDYPPNFTVTTKCCYYAKKKTARKYEKDHRFDLVIFGLRKAEGGIRSNAYKSCYSENFGSADTFRPIWWFTNDDKKVYEDAFGVVHSDCYTKYGFKRTGCAGCPFDPNVDDEMKAVEIYEPKFFKAANAIFGDAYEYTRRFKEYKQQMDERAKEAEYGVEQIKLDV